MKLDICKFENYDVVVAGGGTAGVFAAISAARSGAKTLLLEKNSVLGGTMTVANVNYPGLFFAWGKQIISGPCFESVERTIKLGGAKMPEISFKPKNHWDEQIILNRFIYTAVLFEMCKEAGVQLLCNSMVSAAEEKEDGIRLIVTAKNGVYEINAKCAIDATGDANLSVLCGFDVAKSSKLQPATLRNHISGYNIENVSIDEIREKFSGSGLPEHINADLIYSYLKRGVLDIHIPCGDADTSEGKTTLEQTAYSILLKVYSFLREIKGLENIEVDFVAEETGVRETNRIVGENLITADDYINGTCYPDSVCYAFYPIDLHVMTGIKMTHLKENVVPKIPYSALIPKNSKFVISCGRCISSDTEANSAIRVEAVCMATGQVAGCAAALVAENGCKIADVKLDKLISNLKNIGAIVPEIPFEN